MQVSVLNVAHHITLGRSSVVVLGGLGVQLKIVSARSVTSLRRRVSLIRCARLPRLHVSYACTGVHGRARAFSSESTSRGAPCGASSVPSAARPSKSQVLFCPFSCMNAPAYVVVVVDTPSLVPGVPNQSGVFASCIPCVPHSALQHLPVLLFLYPSHAVRVATGVEFAEHVFSHSVSAEALALRPPGCALRAYGCRACSTTNLVPTASSAARNPSEGIDTVEGFASGSEALNGSRVEGEVGKKAHGKDRQKDNGGGDAAGRFVHILKRCPLYWLFCPSCEQEVRWMFG